jgi:chromate transporter
MTIAGFPSSARADLPVWLRIGLLSFGGPAGQIALMHRLLVDELRWIDERGFLAGLNFCMLLPGPEAQQLATWVGWRRAGWLGALVAGGLFVLPGMLCMLVLSAAYVTFGELRPVSAAFLGVKCAVLSIVLEALLRIGRRALKFRGAGWIAGAAFVAIYIVGVPFPLIVGGAALLGWLMRAAPGAGHARPERSALTGHLHLVAAALVAWVVPVAVVVLLTGVGSMFSRIGLFYSVVAIVTFGGAYAVLGYVADRAVGDWGWLDARQMADGLGLAETTPGPLILVLQFVAFVAMFQATASAHPYALAVAASVLASWVLFVPSFVWIFLGGPYVESINADERLRGALSFVTAAVVGVVLNLAVWFAMHVVFTQVGRVAAGPFEINLPVVASFDPRALGLVVLAAALMFGLKRGIGTTLALSALAGLAVDYVPA